MLAYILALVVGLGSLSIYLAAFLLPEIHRKSDFYWSGVGLFYALVLWVCAGRITGGVLLGQIAGVAILGWFVWQTLTLRRQLIPVSQQTPLPSPEVAAQKVKEEAASLTQNLQSKLDNFSMPAGVSQLPQRLGGLLTTAKTRVGEMVSAAKKPKQKPSAVQSKPSVTIVTTTPTEAVTPPTVTPVTTIPAEVVTPPTVTPPTTATSDEEWDTPVVAPVPPVTETVQSTPQGISAQAPVVIENIAPEVELVPPPEPSPIGDSTDKKSLDVQTPATLEVATTPTPTTDAAKSSPSPFSGLVTPAEDGKAEDKTPPPQS